MPATIVNVTDLTPSQKRIFKALQKSGQHGMTCEQIEDVTRIVHQTASPALLRLRDLDIVTFAKEYVNGNEVVKTRLTRQGRPAWVYTLTPEYQGMKAD